MTVVGYRGFTFVSSPRTYHVTRRHSSRRRPVREDCSATTARRWCKAGLQALQYMCAHTQRAGRFLCSARHHSSNSQHQSTSRADVCTLTERAHRYTLGAMPLWRLPTLRHTIRSTLHSNTMPSPPILSCSLLAGELACAPLPPHR